MKVFPLITTSLVSLRTSSALNPSAKVMFNSSAYLFFSTLVTKSFWEYDALVAGVSCFGSVGFASSFLSVDAG